MSDREFPGSVKFLPPGATLLRKVIRDAHGNPGMRIEFDEGTWIELLVLVDNAVVIDSNRRIGFNERTHEAWVICGN